MSHLEKSGTPGSWPVMLTPFKEDYSIDWEQVVSYTEWLIERGTAGIFTVALSSEMYHLTPAERSRLISTVVEQSAGRVPVIASAITPEALDAKVDEVARAADLGVDGVVMIPSLLAAKSDPDTVLLDAIDRIVESVPEVPLGFYECPLPYHRLLTTEVLEHAAQTGRFRFIKDTTHSVEIMSSRIKSLPSLSFFNAEIASLSDTLRAGGAGFSGYAANIYPELVEWLCSNFADSEHAPLVQRLLTIAEQALQRSYPSSAKYLLSHSSSLNFTPVSRWRPTTIDAHQGRPLTELALHIAEQDALGHLLAGR